MKSHSEWQKESEEIRKDLHELFERSDEVWESIPNPYEHQERIEALEERLERLDRKLDRMGNRLNQYGVARERALRKELTRVEEKMDHVFEVEVERENAVKYAISTLIVIAECAREHRICGFCEREAEKAIDRLRETEEEKYA